MMKSLGISGFCQRPILQQEFGGASRMEIAKMTKIQILGRAPTRWESQSKAPSYFTQRKPVSLVPATGILYAKKIGVKKASKAGVTNKEDSPERNQSGKPA
jgi:hypothetical protein